MIGFNKISELCKVIELILTRVDIDWKEIENQCELLNNEFEVLEILNSK
jgi:hypothetical protein